MSYAFKALAVLLSYPDEALRPVYPAVAAALEAEPRIGLATRRALARLTAELAEEDLLDLQGRYVQLFDRSRSLSLNLYEHVHGESRDRGQAMVELLSLYSAHGLELSARELPDHLPVFLEFLSILPTERADALLGEALHVIEAIAERLGKRRSPYAAPLRALVDLSRAPADAQALRSLLDLPEDDPDDLEALDRTWAEEPVTFGPGEVGCPKAAALVEQMGGAAQ